MELHQTRTYGWNGSAFVQTGGPTSFSSHDKPTDLSLRIDGVTWGSPQGGFRTGIAKVTVTNKGPYRSDEFLVMDNAQFPPPPPVRHGSLGVGESVQLTITVKQPAQGGPSGNQLQLYEMGSPERNADVNPADNLVTYPLWPGA